jgi:hypothetical protein
MSADWQNITLETNEIDDFVHNFNTENKNIMVKVVDDVVPDEHFPFFYDLYKKGLTYPSFTPKCKNIEQMFIDNIIPFNYLLFVFDKQDYDNQKIIDKIKSDNLSFSDALEDFSMIAYGNVTQAKLNLMVDFLSTQTNEQLDEIINSHKTYSFLSHLRTSRYDDLDDIPYYFNFRKAIDQVFYLIDNYPEDIKTSNHHDFSIELMAFSFDRKPKAFQDEIDKYDDAILKKKYVALFISTEFRNELTHLRLKNKDVIEKLRQTEMTKDELDSLNWPVVLNGKFDHMTIDSHMTQELDKAGYGGFQIYKNTLVKLMKEQNITMKFDKSDYYNVSLFCFLEKHGLLNKLQVTNPPDFLEKIEIDKVSNYKAVARYLTPKLKNQTRKTI